MKVSLKTMTANFFCFQTLVPLKKKKSRLPCPYIFWLAWSAKFLYSWSWINVQLLISRAAGQHNFTLDTFSTCFQQIIHHKCLFFSPHTLLLPSFLFLPSRKPGVCCFRGPLILSSHKPPCSSVISLAAGTQVPISFCSPCSCCSGF